MSPEDQRVWEEDAETEYAEAHAQAEEVSQDVGEVEWARVARYAEAICRAESVWLNVSDAPEEVRAEYQRMGRAVLPLADSEQAALVAENERLRAESVESSSLYAQWRASAAEVEAAQKAMGCITWTDSHGLTWCQIVAHTRPNAAHYADRGCPVAVAVADAVVAAAQPQNRGGNAAGVRRERAGHDHARGLGTNRGRTMTSPSPDDLPGLVEAVAEAIRVEAECGQHVYGFDWTDAARAAIKATVRELRIAKETSGVGAPVLRLVTPWREVQP